MGAVTVAAPHCGPAKQQEALHIGEAQTSRVLGATTGPTSMTTELPIAHIVPLGNENKWSDLVAVLIEADPQVAAIAFGLREAAGPLRVQREAPAAGRDRIDLVIHDADGPSCLVEAKVLSGLGVNQLLRYSDAYPEATNCVLLSPERLPLHLGSATGWRQLSWEYVLGCFADSSHPWVAQTARAWVANLQRAMPQVSAETSWGRREPDEDFVIALREENLPVRDFPKTADGTGPAVRGPSVKVCLLQKGVRTSADFDWDYLLSLWPTMADSGIEWVTSTARPKAPHDRAAWQRMVARGGPRYLGIGFGDAQARTHDECMFGARFQLPATVALAEVTEALQQTTDLMLALASTEPPSRPG